MARLPKERCVRLVEDLDNLRYQVKVAANKLMDTTYKDVFQQVSAKVGERFCFDKHENYKTKLLSTIAIDVNVMRGNHALM